MPGTSNKFTSVGYDSIVTYLFAPALGGIIAGFFCHVNGWALQALELSKKTDDDNQRSLNNEI